MALRRTTILALLGLGLATGLVASPASAAPAAPADPCYFTVTIPSPSRPAVLPAATKARIAACAKVLSAGTSRVVVRVGKKPTSTELAWQSAILKEFVRNGCANITNQESGLNPCKVFGEKWPYGYAGQIAKPGTVIVMDFEPI